MLFIFIFPKKIQNKNILKNGFISINLRKVNKKKLFVE